MRTRKIAFARDIFLTAGFLISGLMTACGQTSPTASTPITPIKSNLEASATSTLAVSFLQKASPGDVRLMSYNIGWDTIFPNDDPQNDPFRMGDRSETFIRILKAIQPDILCLQEINPARRSQKVGDILDSALPLPDGNQWRTYRGTDNLIAARFDLSLTETQSASATGLTTLGHVMALVDLPDSQTQHDLYIICAHFKSGGGAENIASRQEHADRITAWIQDVRSPGGEIDLADQTPFVIAGDFNVYDTDPHRHLMTLLSGDILDNKTFGPDQAPDWDGTWLADALPYHNASGEEVYTWRDDQQTFNPGALDRILYTDSQLAMPHSFVLNTTLMTESDLRASGLQAEDVVLDPKAGIYDHLPLIVDFDVR